MANMTHVWWRAAGPRRGRLLQPLASSHPGYAAPCVLCPRPLGGTGAQALELQAVVVGPAQGDEEGARRHEAGLWYHAAAIVVHAECLDYLNDEHIERLVAELVMVPTADFPAQPPLSESGKPTDPGVSRPGGTEDGSGRRSARAS